MRIPTKLLDGVLQGGVDSGAVAGVAAIAATGQDVIYEGAFGRGNLETASPMALDSVFWIMSLTKALTATACMQLIERGLVSLDQHASDILPQLSSPSVLEGFDADGRPRLRPARRPITLSHLLTHTSGFTYAIWSEAMSLYQQVTGTPDIGSGLNAAFDVPLEFDPGEDWAYGIGLDWIGKIVEKVSGESLDVYFRDNIFDPLAMADSGFRIDAARRRRVATMFARQDDGSLAPLPFEMPQQPEFFMGGGAAFSTPMDYGRFLRALLDGGRCDGARILQPGSVATMLSNQIGSLAVREMRSVAPAYSRDFDLFPGQRHGWGISFDINEQAGPHGRSAGSAAWAGLLNCHYWIDPARNIAAAMFTQTLPFCDDAVMALYAAFERQLYRELSV